MDEFQWIKSFATSSYGTINEAPLPSQNHLHPVTSRPSRGSFASFVCHVVNLENKLRSLTPIVLDDSSIVKETGRILGEGTTFMVKHAQWTKDPNEPPLDVALKEIIADVSTTDSSFSTASHRSQGDWKDILFELRALLHEPIRYHPNLVRLLGIQWGLSPMSESVYPLLIMEYGSFGTFNALQASSGPLSFATKQKLCYDIGRGLSALHACGIVHGDMKHENVLIFPTKEALDGIPYTAKLSDFGGTVMDMLPTESRIMETWTWPFEAPEVTAHQPLTKSGMMLTDTYSFGLLLWRAFTDGESFVSLPGATQTASDLDKRGLSAQKSSDNFTSTALAHLDKYASDRGIPQTCVEIFKYAVLLTVRLKPEDRDLTKAQAALRGIKPGHIPSYLRFIQEMNDERAATEARRVPGRHGITQDANLFMLGRWGDDADLQSNLPGNRPRLDEPNPEGFSFEPETLKKVLTWNQQRQMLDDMKDAAKNTARPANGLPEMKKTVAAFYVFQCCLLEFGTTFDSNEAIEWLKLASDEDDSHEDADYFSQAWLWRVARALGVNLTIDTERLHALLRISAMRGHRSCLQDMLELGEGSGDALAKERWLNTHRQSRHFLLSRMGAVGMGYFFSSYMTVPWNRLSLDDLPGLDSAIQEILGGDFGSCLKSSSHHQDTRTQPGERREKTPFDRIYVNRRGHGPLHYAAASGALGALRHLITTYECDIDLQNQHVYETALVCAAAAGQFDCALLLLENGADPNGHRSGQEGPLHWLCSFLPADMETIATKLVAAGADIELRSGGMRHDVRDIRADWERLFEIRTTPLGRAVLMNSLDAVKVLLKLGADPLTKSANNHRKNWEGMENRSKKINVSSPFELAAVLALPEILGAFIMHIDGPAGTPRLDLIDDVSMLDLAHGRTVTTFDPLSLQSRLVRNGVNYQRDLQITLALLYARSKIFHETSEQDVKWNRSRVLCKEVELGNLDTVAWLLTLGYHVDGTQKFRPLENAVRTNNMPMFQLLRRHNADAKITQMTPNGTISLLHICASRPKQARPGRAIADALIAAGVPLESTDVRSRSPLATAVLNQNFDVATALIENGANVSATYPLQLNSATGPETKTVSVLVEILSQHTIRTLESLKFLFNQYKNGLSSRPAFYIDPTNRLSILHLLAGSPQYTHIAQITPKILNLCLNTYAEPELINYKHPILGTPLYYAAANGHKAMVERLLEHGADTTCKAGPDSTDSVQTLLRPRESWTPLWAAILRLDDELKKGSFFPPAGAPGAWLGSNMIQNLEKTIAMLLQHDNDAAAQQAVEKLQQRKLSLEAEARIHKLDLTSQKSSMKTDKIERPVDLGVLYRGSKDVEQRLQEICAGPEEEWRTEGLERFFQGLEL